jgi:UDP-GlcNAc:undecaprenyl-phosphate GlcNAc-1-phosphate transferase
VAISKAVTLSSVFTIITLTFLFRFKEYSRVVFIIDWLLALFLISGIRILIRLLHEYFSSLTKGKKNLLIFGAGDMGELVLRELKRNKNLNYNPIGFIDDDISKVGRQIHGVSILGTRKEIPSFLEDRNIDEVLIAVSFNKIKDPQKLVALLREFNISYKELSGILDK